MVPGQKTPRRNWHLEQQALSHTLWRTRFGRDYGPVLRETREWKKAKIQLHF